MNSSTDPATDIDDRWIGIDCYRPPCIEGAWDDGCQQGDTAETLRQITIYLKEIINNTYKGEGSASTPFESWLEDELAGGDNLQRFLNWNRRSKNPLTDDEVLRIVWAVAEGDREKFVCEEARKSESLAEFCVEADCKRHKARAPFKYDLSQVVRLDEAEVGGVGVNDGGVLCRVELDKDGKKKIVAVCDGFCHITEQVRREDGAAIFTLSGRGSRDGHVFKFTMPAQDFADNRKLSAQLTAQFGALNRVNGLTGYVIQSVTKSVTNWRLFTASKWDSGKLAIPGLELIPNARYDLPRQIPADVSGGDLEGALECLDLAMGAWESGNMAVLLTSILGAPAISQMFPDDRYGLALAGLTGTGKTAAAQLMMSIYGQAYLSESILIRWGDGTTVNAAMKLAESAGCLPFLIDNYKPLHRNGPQQLISFIHGVLEGGGKNRLNRNAELLETAGYECLPLVTGEDFPATDSASIARMIVLPWSGIKDTGALSEAQILAHHLPALGRGWAEWLSSAEGQKAMAQVEALFDDDRRKAREALHQAGCINPGRVASNVAVLKAVWRLMIRCPFLQDTVMPFSSDFEKAIDMIMRTTTTATTEANEGEQFIGGLQELVNSRRVVILGQIDPHYQPGQYYPAADNKPVIGWQEGDRIFLFPKVARQAVNQLIGNDGQALSAGALNRQLLDRGYILDHDDGKATKKKKYGSAAINALVLSADLFVPDVRTAIDTTDQYLQLKTEELAFLPAPGPDAIAQAAQLRDV